jgi:drug/metabolite transporter (DMT)-like permease
MVHERDSAKRCAVVGLGLLSTALVYVLYFRILAASGAVNLLLVTFLIPVSAILLGATVLGETLLRRQLVGMALIGIGLACLDGRLPRLIVQRRAALRASSLR